ncbi:MAG: hypothetical protein ACFFD4_13395 [Candidatus Odinarchaeota archaeon]
MTSISFSIPEDLKRIIDKHSTVNWDDIVRKALWAQARKLELVDSLASKSDLTEEEDALEIGRELKKRIAERHGL